MKQDMSTLASQVRAVISTVFKRFGYVYCEMNVSLQVIRTAYEETVIVEVVGDVLADSEALFRECEKQILNSFDYAKSSIFYTNDLARKWKSIISTKPMKSDF